MFHTTVKVLVLVNLAGICLTSFTPGRFYRNPDPIHAEPIDLVISRSDRSKLYPLTREIKSDMGPNHMNPKMGKTDETLFLRPVQEQSGETDKRPRPIRSIL